MISPRISFIVVTHRRPRFLSRALESIRRQTISETEIIVVVNGPDPETRRVIDTLGFEVGIHELPENRGVGAGRNAGIAAARGELLFFSTMPS
jgi:glycosyltransferase involved in cell wall biosynthesis